MATAIVANGAIAARVKRVQGVRVSAKQIVVLKETLERWDSTDERERAEVLRAVLNIVISLLTQQSGAIEERSGKEVKTIVVGAPDVKDAIASELEAVKG